MIREDRLVDLFLNLIQINAPAREEAAVVAWTRQYLEAIGLHVREDNAGAEIGGNANNLIATLPGNLEGAPRIFLSAHFDTVEPTAGLVVEEVDGVFRSASDTILGADDKGGMAPAIEAVHAIIESGAPHGDITLLLSVAEEIGLMGADAVKLEELNLDFGFVLDTGPPVGSFVNRAGTHDKLDVIVHGKPAHAGKDPEKGINAIVVAATAIANMKIGRIGPETTANVGRIEGGTATNVVPAEVKLYCEARSTDIEALDAQIGHMVQTFEAAAAQFGTTVTIEHVRHYVGYEVPLDSPVAQVAKRASEALGFNPVFRTTLGGSDGNIYNAKGLPCVVVATGMDKIHTHDEFISRRDLVDTARLAYQILLESANL
jgi:tripeptide aminopeptidase